MSNNQDNDIFSFDGEHPTEVEKNEKKPFSVSDELKAESSGDVFSATTSTAPAPEAATESDSKEEEKPKKVGNPLFESKGGLAIVAVGVLAAVTIGYFKFFAGNSSSGAEQVAYQELPAVTAQQAPSFEEEPASQPDQVMEPPPVDMGYSDPSMAAPVYVDPQTGQPITAPGENATVQPPMQGMANPPVLAQPQPPVTYTEPSNVAMAPAPTMAPPTTAPAMAAPMSPQMQAPAQVDSTSSNLLAELGAEQQKNLELMKENETLKKQLADARGEAAGLRKKVALARTQPKPATQKQETTAKKTSGSESNSSEVASKFKIKAIVEGLAWIESPLGQTLAVRGGDSLTSDMRVISIDPVQMVVKTNKGEIK